MSQYRRFLLIVFLAGTKVILGKTKRNYCQNSRLGRYDTVDSTCPAEEIATMVMTIRLRTRDGAGHHSSCRCGLAGCHGAIGHTRDDASRVRTFVASFPGKGYEAVNEGDRLNVYNVGPALDTGDTDPAKSPPAGGVVRGGAPITDQRTMDARRREGDAVRGKLANMNAQARAFWAGRA
jgi:hypothetical protein